MRSLNKKEAKKYMATLDSETDEFVSDTRKQPHWEAFGKAIMEYWPESLEVDCFQIQELAEKHNIILPVKGGYDPEKHGESEYGEEPGDPYFEVNYETT